MMIINRAYKAIAGMLMTGLIGVFFTAPVCAQQIALKTNLAYWATTSANVALEMRLSPRATLDIGGGLNLWNLKTDTKLKHWAIQPEARIWTCEAYNGHFFGVHVHGGQYNVGGIDLPVGRLKKFKDHRYQGYFYGAGLSYGYQWICSRHWNVEASVGAGYARIHYEKYPCATCGTKLGEGNANYWGLTRATLSVAYLF